MPGVKEFEQMRFGTNLDIPLLEGKTEEFYTSCMNMGRDVLTALAQEIQTRDVHALADLMDRDDGSTNISSSIFRYFRYFSLDESDRTKACDVHTDIGLLTFIPVSNNPSLEIEVSPDEFENFEGCLNCWFPPSFF